MLFNVIRPLLSKAPHSGSSRLFESCVTQVVFETWFATVHTYTILRDYIDHIFIHLKSSLVFFYTVTPLIVNHFCIEVEIPYVTYFMSNIADRPLFKVTRPDQCSSSVR